MSKKYSPSGYVIIDLGVLDLEESKTLTPDDNDDVKTLISLFYDSGVLNEKLKKPVLLKVYDSSTKASYMGFVIQSGIQLQLTGYAFGENSVSGITVRVTENNIVVSATWSM